MAATNSQKAFWNAMHYDYISVPVYTGMREEIREYAQEQGYTLAGYIRHLIIADMSDTNPEISAKIGGGGTLKASEFLAYIAERTAENILDRQLAP